MMADKTPPIYEPKKSSQSTSVPIALSLSVTYRLSKKFKRKGLAIAQNINRRQYLFIFSASIYSKGTAKPFPCYQQSLFSLVVVTNQCKFNVLNITAFTSISCIVGSLYFNR